MEGEEEEEEGEGAGTLDDVQGRAGLSKEKTLCLFVCEGGDPEYMGEHALETAEEFYNWWKANQNSAWPKASLLNTPGSRLICIYQTVEWMAPFGFEMTVKQVKGLWGRMIRKYSAIKARENHTGGGDGEAEVRFSCSIALASSHALFRTMR